MNCNLHAANLNSNVAVREEAFVALAFEMHNREKGRCWLNVQSTLVSCARLLVVKLELTQGMESLCPHPRAPPGGCVSSRRGEGSFCSALLGDLLGRCARSALKNRQQVDYTRVGAALCAAETLLPHSGCPRAQKYNCIKKRSCILPLTTT